MWKALILFLFVAIGAVSANAQKVQVKANPNVNLSQFKTYVWAEGKSSPNPIIHQTIIEAVDRAMTAKGLTKVENGADITVAAFAATDTELYISQPSWMPTLNSIITGIAVGSSSWPVTKGMLVVDLADARTKDAFWRGTATDTLEHGPTGSVVKDARSVEKKINKAVDKMFKKYPRS
jgi:hypothetical protein